MNIASLRVRKNDNEPLSKLHLRARHGVSMEAEVRHILKQPVAAPEKLGDLAVSLFSPACGCPELELPEREARDSLDFRG